MSAHSDPHGPDPELSLWSLAPGAFIPPAVFAVGQGAIAPVVVVSAGQLGASPAAAALVVATAGLGQIVADVPAGAIVHRFGERRTMVAAAGLTVLALFGCIVAPSLALFALAIFLTGVGTAVWLLARQAYLTAVVPFRLRARAMSTLGGVFRIGLFVGPFVGGGAIALFGTDGAYWVHIVAALVAVVVLLLARDLSEPVSAGALTARPSLVGTIRENRPVLGTLGVGVLIVSAVRAARQVALPLWGQQLGLSPATISVIFGISGAIDMLLFYPAGSIMDRRGRTWVGVPSMLVLGAALLALPFTTGVASMIIVGLVLGIGNGLSAGIVMTLGADLAPPDRRAVFLGVWRVFADTGGGVGPFVIAGVTAVATVGVGIAAMGVVGLLGAGWLGYWLPRRGGPQKG